MASEMRRMAKMLVEHRTEAFASRYGREDSARRVGQAIAGFAPKGMVFGTTWREEAGATWLEVSFAPSRATRLLLNTTSAILTLLLAATLWLFVVPAEEPAGRFLVALSTVLAMLAFPFLVVAYGSRREAEESTLRKKIRRAIVEGDGELAK
jgi:hypothetical protein